MHQVVASRQSSTNNHTIQAEDKLPAEPGVAVVPPAEDEITVLRHVRSHAEVQAAEDVAARQPCAGFELFRPRFEQVAHEHQAGLRRALRFGGTRASRRARSTSS